MSAGMNGVIDERETPTAVNDYGITSVTQLMYGTPVSRLAAYGTAP
jgi:hypothetical protein